MKHKQFHMLKKISQIHIPKIKEFEDRELGYFLKDIISLTYNVISFYYFSTNKLEQRRKLTEDEVIQYLYKLLDEVSPKHPKGIPSILGINIPACCLTILQLADKIRKEQKNPKLLSTDIFVISQEVLKLNKIFFTTFSGENDIGRIIYTEPLSSIKEKRKKGGLQKGKNNEPFLQEMYEEQKKWFYEHKAQGKDTYAVVFARTYYKKYKEKYDEDNTIKFPFHFTKDAQMEDDNAFIYLKNKAQLNNRKIRKEYLKNKK